MKGDATDASMVRSLLARILWAWPTVVQTDLAPQLEREESMPTQTGNGSASDEQLDFEWVDSLASALADGDSKSKTSVSRTSYRAQTVDKLLFLLSYAEGLANRFNRSLREHPNLNPLHITCARFVPTGKRRPSETENRRKAMTNDSAKTGSSDHDSVRCRITAGPRSLVLKGKDGVIEIFEVPSDKLFLESDSETPQNLKVTFYLRPVGTQLVWHLDDAPTVDAHQTGTMRILFQQLLRNARTTWQEHKKHGPATWIEMRQGDQSIDELLLTKQTLIHKLVTRQEELTSAIALDLHDVVIADIMLLRRALIAEVALTSGLVLPVLDRVTERLREICYSLSPRDLDDWGLPTVLEDLLDRVSKQMSAHGSFNCPSDLPPLEPSVQLQVYRIVQESLNNTAKYSKAQNVTVDIGVAGGLVRIKVADDGIGFDPEAKADRGNASGGLGMSSLRERLELIRCFHPAKLEVLSQLNHGTTILLEIHTSES